jgi:hypothetical protein
MTSRAQAGTWMRLPGALAERRVAALLGRVYPALVQAEAVESPKDNSSQGLRPRSSVLSMRSRTRSTICAISRSQTDARAGHMCAPTTPTLSPTTGTWTSSSGIISLAISSAVRHGVNATRHSEARIAEARSLYRNH